MTPALSRGNSGANGKHSLLASISKPGPAGDRWKIRQPLRTIVPLLFIYHLLAAGPGLQRFAKLISLPYVPGQEPGTGGMRGSPKCIREIGASEGTQKMAPEGAISSS